MPPPALPTEPASPAQVIVPDPPKVIDGAIKNKLPPPAPPAPPPPPAPPVPPVPPEPQCDNSFKNKELFIKSC